jgi:hypothetical protein
MAQDDTGVEEDTDDIHQGNLEKWPHNNKCARPLSNKQYNVDVVPSGKGLEPTTLNNGKEVPSGSLTVFPPSSPSPLLAPEHIMAMFQGMFQHQQHQQQQQLLQLQAIQNQSGGLHKRKRADDSAAKNKKKFNDDSDANSSDTDEDVKVVEHTPNTARRILWQRGHGSLLPSTVRSIIAEATVRTMAEARVPLQELGFAIIEDMTEVYAPKNRCTKEQQDFIHKCKYASLRTICI